MNIHVRGFSIGELAKAAGVTTPTIRYYEEIGLLPPAARRPSGQRIFTGDDLERLNFIRRCRAFGFPIEQVKLLSGLSTSPDRDCREARGIAAAHLNEVRDRLNDLRELERSLDQFVRQCDATCAGGPGRDCVVFKDLMEDTRDGRC